MKGFHLGSCNPSNDNIPATSGCSKNCPRWLWWQIDALRDALAKAQAELGHDQEELL